MIANAANNKAELDKSTSNSLNAYSAIPLAPGVGLTNKNNHMTNCFASMKMCLVIKIGRNAAMIQLTTKYRDNQLPQVAKNDFIQNPLRSCFNSFAASSIELAVFSALDFHFFIKGNKKRISTNLKTILG